MKWNETKKSARAHLINAHTSMNRVAFIIYLLMEQPERINSNEKRVNSTHISFGFYSIQSKSIHVKFYF